MRSELQPGAQVRTRTGKVGTIMDRPALDDNGRPRLAVWVRVVFVTNFDSGVPHRITMAVTYHPNDLQVIRAAAEESPAGPNCPDQGAQR